MSYFFKNCPYCGSISITVFCSYLCRFFLDPNRQNFKAQAILARRTNGKGNLSILKEKIEKTSILSGILKLKCLEKVQSPFLFTPARSQESNRA